MAPTRYPIILVLTILAHGLLAHFEDDSRGLKHYQNLPLQPRAIQVSSSLALTKRGGDPFKSSDQLDPGTSTVHSWSGDNSPSKLSRVSSRRTDSARRATREVPSTSDLPVSFDPRDSAILWVIAPRSFQRTDSEKDRLLRNLNQS